MIGKIGKMKGTNPFDAQNPTAKKTNLRYLGRVIKDLYKIMPVEITVLLLFKIINAVAAAAQVYITAALFDTAGKFFEGKADGNTLLLWCGAFVGILALPQIISIIERPIDELKINWKHHTLINKLHSRVVSMPLVQFEESGFHDELWRAKMCIYNKGLINYFNGFMDYLPNIFRLIGTIGVLASFNISFVPLAIISVVPAFIQRWGWTTISRNLYEKLTYLFRIHDYLWGVFTDKNTVKELRTMNTEKYIADKWITARDELNDEYFRVEMKATTREFIFTAIKLFGLFLSIGLSVFFLTKNIITIGQFAACIAAFIALQGTAFGFMNMIVWQKEVSKTAGDYYDFIDKSPETDGDVKYNGFKKQIEVKNLSFGYPQSESDVLKNVSFTINKGERVIIVGENGSGKTTLSKIIAGVYEPSSGEVLYDGENIKDFERASFYRQFSVISQDFVKYQLSLRDNIGISMPNRIHDDERLMRSAEAANIENIVKRIGGLDAQLGREFDGVELSGGEWQKVAIARGLNKDSDIIILDEPTSALDPLVEYDILSKFANITKGKTSIIISHRVGLCKFADRIIVMKNGEAAETGTHSELLDLNGEYSRIWNEQAKWYI
jgi:ABC-type multidrug transport system fused ATPase/permease subunit